MERLAGVVEQAQRTTSEREQERRALSEQLQALEARNRHLEQQLSDRSALVVTLEEDQAEVMKRREALQQERDQFEEALMRAERNVKENADYVAALDAKLDRQKELIESLEEELAEAKEDLAAARKTRPERHAASADGASVGGPAAAELEGLREQVRKLEGLVRERTDELNRVTWQRRLAGPEDGADAEQADAGADAAAAESDRKLLVVLNQQLADERARNDELRRRLRELESSSSPAASAPRDGDDLTRIHGVGEKLAEQLNELGIYRYQQIAELDESALDDEAHILFGHRGRILRDGWIDQAVRLISH